MGPKARFYGWIQELAGKRVNSGKPVDEEWVARQKRHLVRREGNLSKRRQNIISMASKWISHLGSLEEMQKRTKPDFLLTKPRKHIIEEAETKLKLELKELKKKAFAAKKLRMLSQKTTKSVAQKEILEFEAFLKNRIEHYEEFLAQLAELKAKKGI